MSCRRGVISSPRLLDDFVGHLLFCKRKPETIFKRQIVHCRWTLEIHKGRVYFLLRIPRKMEQTDATDVVKVGKCSIQDYASNDIVDHSVENFGVDDGGGYEHELKSESDVVGWGHVASVINDYGVYHEGAKPSYEGKQELNEEKYIASDVETGACAHEAFIERPETLETIYEEIENEASENDEDWNAGIEYKFSHFHRDAVSEKTRIEDYANTKDLCRNWDTLINDNGVTFQKRGFWAFDNENMIWGTHYLAFQNRVTSWEKFHEKSGGDGEAVNEGSVYGKAQGKRCGWESDGEESDDESEDEGSELEENKCDENEGEESGEDVVGGESCLGCACFILLHIILTYFVIYQLIVSQYLL